MLGDINRVAHVGKLVGYLVSKEEARVLGGNAELVRGPGAADDELLAKDVRDEIKLLRALRPKVGKFGAHMFISLPEDRQLPDHEWKAIVERAMKQLNYKDVPFVMVRHADTAKDHVHVVMAAIDRSGERVADFQEKNRLRGILRELRLEKGLQHPKLDALEESVRPIRDGVDHEAREQDEGVALPMRAAQGFEAPRTLAKPDRADLIRGHLRQSHSVTDFIDRLRSDGIRPSFNVSPGTGRVSGISYELAGKRYKGRSLGKDLAWGPIEKKLNLTVNDMPRIVEANREAGEGHTEVVKKLTREDISALGERGRDFTPGQKVRITARGFTSEEGLSHEIATRVEASSSRVNDYQRQANRLEKTLRQTATRSQSLASFLENLRSQGIESAFHFNSEARPSGLAYKQDGRWYSGSKVKQPWTAIRRRYRPSLNDLPVMLRSNELAGSGATELKHVLDDRRLHTHREVVLVSANARGLHLEPIKKIPHTDHPQTDFRSQRAKLRAALGKFVESGKLELSRLGEYEELARLAAYADGRYEKHLPNYRQRRLDLGEWRKELLKGHRTDLRQYLETYDRFQRLRALRTYRRALRGYGEALDKLKGMSVADVASAEKYWLRHRQAARRRVQIEHYRPSSEVYHKAQIQSVHRQQSPTALFDKKSLSGKEIADKAMSIPGQFSPKHLLKGAVALGVGVARMTAEMLAENVARKAFEIPESAIVTYRVLRGRFTSVAISAAIKAIKAENAPAALGSLSVKAPATAAKATLSHVPKPTLRMR